MKRKQNKSRRDGALPSDVESRYRRIVTGELSEAVRKLADVPHVLFLNGHLAQPAIIKLLDAEVGLLGGSPRVELDLSPRIVGSVSESEADIFAPLWRIPKNQEHARHSVLEVSQLHQFAVVPIDVPAGMLASFEPVIQGNNEEEPNQQCLDWCIEHLAEVRFVMMRLEEHWPVWKPIVLLSADLGLLQSAMEECVKTNQGEVFSAWGVTRHDVTDTPRA
jgi:hypothetical protein